LGDYATRVLSAVGYPPEDARLCAQGLLEASLRGIDSHGVAILLPHYVRLLRNHRVQVDTEPVIDLEQGAIFRVKGRHALGARTIRFAIEHAIARCSQFGIGAAAVAECGYLGALAVHLVPFSAHDRILLLTSNSEACVAPFGGIEPLHGTNPIAALVPAGKDRALVMDMRTNALRMADYWQALDSDGELPEGAVLQASGSPTVRPADADGGVYLPAGAKGYVLALLVDVLTAGLSGGPIGQDLRGVGPEQYSAFVLALDPTVLNPDGGFDSAIERLGRQARSVKPADPSRPVRLPGERAERERSRRVERGIPVARERFDTMLASLRAEGVDTKPPSPLEGP
jgi:LDH2 family malate/lactate/ureidoglycolate dehydrogenase